MTALRPVSAIFVLVTALGFTVEAGTYSDPDAMMVEEAAMPDAMLFDFSTPADLEAWVIVNDGVMGGLSQSRMRPGEGDTAIFEGILSMENNGGFASVRTRPARLETIGAKAVKVRVRGDGRVYQLRLRTDDRFDGVAYRKDFETEKGEWVTVTLPLGEFVPSFRGYVVPDVPPVDPADIRQIGFLLADKKPGDFQLEVDWIATVE